MKVKQTLSFDGMPNKWFEDEVVFEGTQEECEAFIVEDIEKTKQEYSFTYEVDYVVVTKIDDKTWIVLAFSIEYIDDAITCKLELVD